MREEAERLARQLKRQVIICPECGEEINHLHFYAWELQRADFDGEKYSNWGSVGELEGYHYACPHCQYALFEEEDEAKKFLKRK